MRNTRKSLLVILTIASCAGAASAHQPRLVDDRPSIQVRNPGISQAFYARLSGRPQSYIIRSDEPLRLYINLLVPEMPGIETDYEALIVKEAPSGRQIVARLDGKTFEWKPFFEPFGGDHYRRGPEYDEVVPAGTYVVTVSSPDNMGKYALAIGKVEKFPPGEMARILVTLPALKSYFGRSPWTAYFNLSGLFLLVMVAAVAGAAALVVVIRRRRRSPRAGASKISAAAP